MLITVFLFFFFLVHYGWQPKGCAITIAQWSGDPGNPFGKFCSHFLIIYYTILSNYLLLIYFVILFQETHRNYRIRSFMNIYNCQMIHAERRCDREEREILDIWLKACTWPNFPASDRINPIRSRKIGIVSFIKFYV